MKPSHSYFNSIKVRLEPEEPQPGETAQEFQFHKGTIRTQEMKQTEQDQH